MSAAIRTVAGIAFGWFLGDIITGKPFELRFAVVGAFVAFAVLVASTGHYIIEGRR